MATARLKGSAIRREINMKLDKNYFPPISAQILNPNTSQKNIFCARQHMAAGLALYIFPDQPGAAS